MVHFKSFLLGPLPAISISTLKCCQHYFFPLSPAPTRPNCCIGLHSQIGLVLFKERIMQLKEQLSRCRLNGTGRLMLVTYTYIHKHIPASDTLTPPPEGHERWVAFTNGGPLTNDPAFVSSGPMAGLREWTSPGAEKISTFSIMLVSAY